MNHDDFDEGLVHGHSWANGAIDRTQGPQVADASKVNTPSSAWRDDTHEARHQAE